MEYYIADLHFCHKNIPKFEPTRAQFIDNVDLMNETIINNWNAVVTDEDIVNIIGDVGIGAQANIVECVKRLNGKLRLWPGNHDHGNLLKKLQSEAGVEVMPYMTKIKTHGVVVFVTHYPMDIGERPNLFNIHGHIHSEPSRLRNQINVGVDQDWGLPFGQPIPKEMVEERILKMSEVLRHEKELSVEKPKHPSEVFVKWFEELNSFGNKTTESLSSTEKEKLARMLWLWYDYHTEKYDRTLPHTPVGRWGVALVTGEEFVKLSNGYARNLYLKMKKVSFIFGIEEEFMFKAKMSSYRAVHVDKMFEQYREMIEHESDLFERLKAAGL